MIAIEELMTSQLYTLRETDSLYEARKLMAEQHIRHILITDETGLFVGLLSQRDVLAATVSTFADISNAERDEVEAGIPLLEIMTTDVIVAEQGTSLLEAAHFLLETKHGCLPVVANGYLKGIITEADFVKLTLELLDKLARYQSEAARGVKH